MVCTEPYDHSEKSPIEPSAQGGEKIATRMVEALLGQDFSKPACRIYK
jgi:hypothetical protein